MRRGLADWQLSLLCKHFLEKHRQRYQRSVKTISAAAYSLLSHNRWPGNVRDLENAIERGVILCKGTELRPGDLPESLQHGTSGPLRLVTPPDRTLAEIEKVAILQTPNLTNWNKQETAPFSASIAPRSATK